MAELMNRRERRLVADAFRDYAATRYEAHLEHPEVPWMDQPSEMSKRYARTAAELRAEADRFDLIDREPSSSETERGDR